jgi:hypothetical protein
MFVFGYLKNVGFWIGAFYNFANIRLEHVLIINTTYQRLTHFWDKLEVDTVECGKKLICIRLAPNDLFSPVDQQLQACFKLTYDHAHKNSSAA